jgi:hypothetical protein
VTTGLPICQGVGAIEKYPNPHLEDNILAKGYQYVFYNDGSKNWYLGYKDVVPNFSNCISGECLVVCEIEKGSCFEP